MERELATVHLKAITAIARRNALRSKLQARLEEAFDSEPDLEDTEIAKRLGAREKRPRDREIGFADPEIAKLRRALDEAEKEASAVKETIRAFEAQIRGRATDRLHRLGGWNAAKIQAALNRALSGISIDKDVQRYEEEYRRARE